jgi:hypothetical protein
MGWMGLSVHRPLVSDTLMYNTYEIIRIEGFEIYQCKEYIFNLNMMKAVDEYCELRTMNSNVTVIRKCDEKAH